jgi:hypothetical protein
MFYAELNLEVVTVRTNFQCLPAAFRRRSLGRGRAGSINAHARKYHDIAWPGHIALLATLCPSDGKINYRAHGLSLAPAADGWLSICHFVAIKRRES